MFAELEKMSKQQRDHIEAAREKRAEDNRSTCGGSFERRAFYKAAAFGESKA